MLTATKVTSAEGDDAREVERLLKAAFPANEQAPFAALGESAQCDDVSLLAYRDDGIFCGFVFMVEDERLAYILYLAVDERLRSQGYGGRILGDVAQRCAGKTVTLDIELVEEGVADLARRTKRRAFYLRNGFQPTGFAVCYAGDTFEALACGEDFEEGRFAALVTKLPRGDGKTVVPMKRTLSDA